jgi:hypothetical protein
VNPDSLRDAATLGGKIQEWKVRHDPWDHFIFERNKEIEIFMETGDLVFTVLPLVDSAGETDMCEVVKKDCNDLIAIIEITALMSCQVLEYKIER